MSYTPLFIATNDSDELDFSFGPDTDFSYMENLIMERFGVTYQIYHEFNDDVLTLGKAYRFHSVCEDNGYGFDEIQATFERYVDTVIEIMENCVCQSVTAEQVSQEYLDEMGVCDNLILDAIDMEYLGNVLLQDELYYKAEDGSFYCWN